MYHYREGGLPNVYLTNGYREVKTPYGPSVVIRDVEGLHFAIAQCAVRERAHLTGPELRFIRKFLELTQAQLGELLGLEEQSVRRWERLPRVPKAADRAMRLLFLDITRRDRPDLPHLDEIVQHTSRARPEPAQLNLRFRPTAKDKWLPQAA
jgi:DNA-binding transcriptional regulator YiaG